MEAPMKDDTLVDVRVRSADEPTLLAPLWDDSESFAPTRSHLLGLEAARLSVARSHEQFLSIEVIEDRISLLRHQLDAAHRALFEMDGGALFADEVGLGKTIEIGIVLKEMHFRGTHRTVLLLAPAQLAPQWREELWSKFGLEFVCTVDEDFEGFDAAVKSFVARGTDAALVFHFRVEILSVNAYQREELVTVAVDPATRTTLPALADRLTECLPALLEASSLVTYRASDEHETVDEHAFGGEQGVEEERSAGKERRSATDDRRTAGDERGSDDTSRGGDSPFEDERRYDREAVTSAYRSACRAVTSSVGRVACAIARNVWRPTIASRRVGSVAAGSVWTVRPSVATTGRGVPTVRSYSVTHTAAGVIRARRNCVPLTP